jgi:hypothetical protein
VEEVDERLVTKARVNRRFKIDVDAPSAISAPAAQKHGLAALEISEHRADLHDLAACDIDLPAWHQERLQFSAKAVPPNPVLLVAADIVAHEWSGSAFS